MTPELGPPIEVLEPETGLAPLVISSPHSGDIYPPSLLRAVRLEQSQLRCLEDGWVDRLFACAPEVGAPLLRARFARAYVDPNREAFELDAELFDGPLPGHVNAGSAKARAGLGTIPSRIGGKPIYRVRLDFGEAERRVRLAYWPYHQALQSLLRRARQAFGVVLLLDCHSMPGFAANGTSESAVDFALGDRFGRSCAPAIVERVEALLRRQGFQVARNRPYAGGHITSPLWPTGDRCPRPADRAPSRSVHGGAHARALSDRARSGARPPRATGRSRGVRRRGDGAASGSGRIKLVARSS